MGGLKAWGTLSRPPGSPPGRFRGIPGNFLNDQILNMFFIFLHSKSRVLGVGTYLGRSAPRFCTVSRRECSESFYGDPFHEDFVLAGVGQRSGAGLHGFLEHTIHLALLTFYREFFVCGFCGIWGDLKA